MSLLSQYGVVISYDHVTKICNNIANVISKSIRQYGVYVPPGFLRNKRIRTSMDNIDMKVNTHDGKGSFHGMALAVYQHSGQGETVLGQVQIDSQSPTSEELQEVLPSTVTKMVACAIEGNPKPTTSSHYPNDKMAVYDEEYNTSQKMTLGGW